VAYEIKCDGHERGLKKIAQFRLTRFAHIHRVFRKNPFVACLRFHGNSSNLDLILPRPLSQSAKERHAGNAVMAGAPCDQYKSLRHIE
jgi:hypothetical protein